MGCNDGGYVGTMDKTMWRKYENKEVEKTEGSVQRVKRGWGGIELYLKDIEEPARLPCKLENEFELIPWQLALVGQKIRYEESVRMDGGKYSRLVTTYKLRICSGPLRNHEYQEPPEYALNKD